MIMDGEAVSALGLRDRIAPLAETWARESDGDYALNPDLRDVIVENAKKDAAVLIAFVERNETLNLILTMRTQNLSNHSGQIALVRTYASRIGSNYVIRYR